MDAVHQTQQNMDIGVCLQHNRVFQCFCTQCYCMICPSCLMFDSHKGHKVCKIQEGVKDVRSKINNAAKDGLLKFENTENVLLDVRHAKLSLQENLQRIIKTTEDHFDRIIKAVKLRKQAFLQEIQQFFVSQLQTIESIQNNWLEKQQICQKVLKLQSSNDDIKIMEQAHNIIQGLTKLSQGTQYHEIKLLENIENHITINKQKIEYEVLKDSFKDFIKKGSIISNKIKH